jgi:hypothetical protein
MAGVAVAYWPKRSAREAVWRAESEGACQNAHGRRSMRSAEESTRIAGHFSDQRQRKSLSSRRVHAAVEGERDGRPMRARELGLLGARRRVAPGQVEVIDATQLVAGIDQAAPKRRTVVHDVLDNEVRRGPVAVEDEPDPAHLLLRQSRRRRRICAGLSP